jgi:outer membrane biosynthesis protein TonB
VKKNMKIKSALIGTVATFAVLGAIGGLADDTTPADSALDTGTTAIVETMETTGTSAPETEPPTVTIQPEETESAPPETTAPQTEPPKPETTAPQTEPPKPETTAPVTETPVKVDTITNIKVTSPISPNSIATLTAKVAPNTEYDISVYYSSSASKADGLEAKVSDANGNISWSWKVGGRTKPGTYRIVIAGGGEKKESTFTVTE